MPQDPAPPRKAKRLSFVENLGFGLGDMASNFFFQTFGIFLFYYYTDVFGIEAGAAGTMFLLTRLFDAFTDPAMGAIADRTKTRWGKFRPYLIWMAIPYGICGYLIFANPDLESAGKLVYAYITYSAMMLAYTAINVPYCALMGVLSPSSYARSIASNFRFACAFGGGLLIALFVRPLVKALGGGNEVLGFQYTMLIFAIASVALFLVTFLTTKERVQPPDDQEHNLAEEIGELFKNRPWVILFAAAICSTTFVVLRDMVTIHYFKYVGGSSEETVFLIFDRPTLFIASGKLMMMIGILFVGFFQRKFDKRPLAVVLSAITGFSILSFYFIPADQFALMMTVNAVSSFVFGPTAAVVWSMYGDAAAYGEFRFGRRSTGLVHSAMLFSMKTGSMIAGALAGLVLDWFGFIANQEQTERSILGITLMFTVVPALFALAKAVALWVYPLGSKEIDEIELELSARKSAQQNA